jgi:DUF4097 and DUF4098 domain-containing protein YvlB
MRPTFRLPHLALALLAGLAGVAPASARAAVLRTALQPPSEEEREREQERRERERERVREQAERDRERVRERVRERAEREKERARELRDRDRERAREQRDHDRDRDETTSQGPTRIDTTVSVGRDASVDLSMVTGNITVTSWGRGEVQVRAYSERLPLRFEHSGSTVRVSTGSNRSRGRAGEQRLEVVVPVGTRVAAQSVSGNVSVRGVRGEVEVGAVSGDVDVQDAVRRVFLNSVSGAVRGSNLDGEVRANAVSGEVTLDDVRGDISSETVSGESTVRQARTSRLRMQSVSGELTYDGAIARDGRYELSSHSGEIHLGLPSDVGASLSLRTFSGSFDSDFELTMRPDGRDGAGRASRNDRRMDFTLGGGGATIVAETFSGTIKLARVGSRR